MNHHDSNPLEFALEAVERPLGEPDVQAERIPPGQHELLLLRTRGVGIRGDGGIRGERDEGGIRGDGLVGKSV